MELRNLHEEKDSIVVILFLYCSYGSIEAQFSNGYMLWRFIFLREAGRRVRITRSTMEVNLLRL